MKLTRRLIAVASLALLFVTSCSNEESDADANVQLESQQILVADSSFTVCEPNLIPAPAAMIRNEGHFSFTSETKIEVRNLPEDSLPQAYLYLSKLLSSKVVAEESDEETYNELSFVFDPTLSGEAYHLNISPNAISITAGTENGWHRGVQCLRQLLPAAFHQDNAVSTEWQVPCLEIQDQPAFAWRGLLLDCSRHFMTKEFVKRYVDLLAFHRMNTLHWHLTEDQGWRIEIDKYPLLTEIGAWRDDGKGGSYGGFYTKEDIREVVAYAQERGINVVPEIELPGHSQAAVAAYPQFSCTGGPHKVETEWGVFKEIYCAGNDSTFVFLQDVLTEVMELFPSTYIHIGGDEAPRFRWEHCEKCQKRIADEQLHDEHELQSWFIQRIDSFLTANGRTLVGWDEILDGGLAENAVVQSWRGFEGAVAAANLGNDVIVSPTSHAYFDYDLNSIDMEKVYNFNPIPADLPENLHHHVLGGECNMWSERAPQPTVDSKVFPRILAMSEVLWSAPAERDFAAFQNRVSNHYKKLDALGVDYGFEQEPISITSEIKERELLFSVSSEIPEMDVYMTSDSSQEFSKWELVDEALRFSNQDRDQEMFFRPLWRNREMPLIVSQLVRPHLALGFTPTIATEYSKWYTGGGDGALTDGLAGTLNFRDGRWQGYWGEDAEVIIDLETPTNISEFSVQCYQYNNAWIFLPSEILVETSLDGSNYQEVAMLTHTVDPKEKGQFIHRFDRQLNSLSARYVKVTIKNLGVCPDWHDAAGSEAWLFVDEIVIR